MSNPTKQNCKCRGNARAGGQYGRPEAKNAKVKKCKR